MPSVPTQLVLPHLITDDRVLSLWSEQLASILIQFLRLNTYTLNALSTVETAANQTTTPDLDEIFFTASDENQTYVAVNAVWTSLGLQRDARRYSLLVGGC